VEMEPFRRRGREWVRFRVDPDPRRPNWIVECESEVEDQRVVRNPGGRGQRRVVIRTEIELAGQRWPIDLTLTNRSEMRFRMLIGREALAGKVLVDARRSDLGGVPPGSARRRKKVSRR
jgi:ribosomal protein S6--L-glutamate ligase